MLDLLDLLASLPALPFTVLLGACSLYWAIALASGLDLGVDGADGAADGALDGAADGALDGAADGALDGADGALDGADWAADAHVDADGVEGMGAMALLAAALRLGRVPITVWLSAFALWGWVVAVAAAWTLEHVLVGLPVGIGAVGAWVASSAVGTALAGVTTRPLEAVFRPVNARQRASLIGEAAEVTTGRVDARFGQARVQLGGDELLVQVRSDRPDNGLERGSEALLVAYDGAREAFIVEALEDGLAKSGSAKLRARATEPQPGDRP